MRRRSSHSPPRFRTDDFPQLREFLRGYLHEDWNDDYGSVREAVEQFCRDAGPASASKLAKEWDELNHVSGRSFETTVEFLGRLGGAWNPTSQEELGQIEDAVTRYRGGSDRK